MDLIYKGSCSDVYLVSGVFGYVLFVKRFKKKKKYTYKGYDLGSLYNRNRPIVSVWGYKFFYKNHILKKYLPPVVFTIGNLNLLFTISRCSKITDLTSSIDNKETNMWINQIEKFTWDMRKASLDIDEEIPGFINNEEVWKLKKELQIVKPLSYLISKIKANALASGLGKCNYVAHGDLQPKNIILEGDKIEIIDFEESFIAPKDWDEGFLWGNLLYLSGNNKYYFNKVVKTWSKLSEGHKNFIIISMAVCLMRVFMFPLNNYTNLVLNRLTKFCLLKINKI